jgi:glycosyltransferase involved in cell wall biosynthesis
VKLGSKAFDPASAARPRDHLRVLCVLPTLNPYGGVLSVVNALNIMVDKGHAVRIISLSRVARDFVHARSEPMYVENWTLIPEAAGKGWDIVLATSWETVEPAIAVRRENPSSAIFYYVQDIEADFYDEPAIRTKALATYSRIPHLIVKTSHLRERLAELGFSSIQIPPGMDLDLFYPRTPPARGLSPPRVLAMARPDTPGDHRGFSILIEVFKALHQRRPTVELAVFGLDSLPDLPFPAVILGRVGPEQLPQIYSSASVFVDTSRVHGFGRTGVEAMACGTPVVLSNSGGISEYAVEGENALIVPVGDVGATVNAIESVLDDQDLAVRLAAQALRGVQHFSDRMAADRLVDIFHRFAAS